MVSVDPIEIPYVCSSTIFKEDLLISNAKPFSFAYNCVKTDEAVSLKNEGNSDFDEFLAKLCLPPYS